jgi:2-dehydropantoate 2-reductase
MTETADPRGSRVAGSALRRIAIVGAGPMGLSLAAITSAHVPTVLVVRDEVRAVRIRDFGVALEGRLSALGHPDVVRSIDDLEDIHPIDLVFVATKTTAIPEVCKALEPYRDKLPYLVSYQNGIEPGRAIVAALGTPRVVRMILRYGAVLDESAGGTGPLRVRAALHQPPHFVGGEGEAQVFSRDLAGLMTTMGLPMQHRDDIDREAWRKGIENAAGNPVAALLQAPLGELLASPAASLIETLLDEGIAVARAAGIEIEPSYRSCVLRTMVGGGGHLPSMAQDVRAGRTTEITQLNEQIARRGRALGIGTPTHDAVLALIGAFDWRAARRSGPEAGKPTGEGST